MNKDTILCVIPARSGSKGVIDKNIRDFNGKPLLIHSLEYAMTCDEIDNVIISTDSEKYANIAKKYNGVIPFIRPKELALDSSQDIGFIKHALIKCEEIYNKKFDLVILLRPTSPLRPAGLIEKGLKMIISDPKATSLKAVTNFKEHPYRHWVANNNYIKGYEDEIFEPYNLPRQELPKLFYSAGELEIIRRSTILNDSVSGKKIIPLILDRDIIVDIDTEEDWKNAEQKLKLLKK